MTPLEKFYTEDPGWYGKIGDIHALLDRVKISGGPDACLSVD